MTEAQHAYHATGGAQLTRHEALIPGSYLQPRLDPCHSLKSIFRNLLKSGATSEWCRVAASARRCWSDVAAVIGHCSGASNQSAIGYRICAIKACSALSSQLSLNFTNTTRDYPKHRHRREHDFLLCRKLRQQRHIRTAMQNASAVLS